MRLTADQELRKELLLFALSKQADLQSAMEMAIGMERFILDGGPERSSECRGEDSDAAAVGTAKGQGHPSAVAPGPGTDPVCAEASGEARGQEKKPRKRRWSEADDRLFRQLWRSDCSLEEMADQLERTAPSLYCRARALGMPRRSLMHQAAQAEGPTPAEQENAAAEEATKAAASDAGLGQARAADVVGASSRIRRQMIGRERYRPAGAGKPAPASGPQRGYGRKAGAGGVTASEGTAAKGVSPQIFVDPIVQFLRSRDYSVVRVGEGQFRLDGRRVVSADELRQKANQVRASLGQPPFASRMGEPVG